MKGLQRHSRRRISVAAVLCHATRRLFGGMCFVPCLEDQSQKSRMTSLLHYIYTIVYLCWEANSETGNFQILGYIPWRNPPQIVETFDVQWPV